MPLVGRRSACRRPASETRPLSLLLFLIRAVRWVVVGAGRRRKRTGRTCWRTRLTRSRTSTTSRPSTSLPSPRASASPTPPT
eukprot:1439476-Rhodomonas_salina.1